MPNRTRGQLLDYDNNNGSTPEYNYTFIKLFTGLACLWCLVLDIHNHFLIQRCAFCWRRLLHLLPSYFGLLQKELSTFTFHTYGLWMFFDKKWFWSFLVVSKTLLRTYNLTAADPICPPSTNNGRAFLISQGIITRNYHNESV